jgi:hypothetical protein
MGEATEIIGIENDAGSLFKDKEYQRVIDILKPFIESGVDSCNIHRLYAESLFFENRYVDSLDSFQHCLKKLSVLCPFGLYQKARSVIGRHPDAKVRAAFWNGCTDAESRIFNNSLAELSVGNFQSARLFFLTGASLVFKSQEEIDLWMQSFDVIASALNNESVPVIHTEHKAIRKLMVSGKGWSGSGAVFDYFMEFGNVAAVKGESQLIENSLGLKNLIKKSSEKKLFSCAVLDFFFYCVLGYAEMKESGSFKSFRQAREIIRSEMSLNYAREVCNVSHFIAACLVCDPSLFQKKVKMLVNQVIDRLVVGSVASENEFVLLDNAIHISALDIVDWIDHLTIFCTLRDPRSNYVALVREFSGFDKSCEEYITQEINIFPRLVNIIESHMKKCSEISHRKVFKVQFEEFVLSEPYRQSLALAAGLDLARQKKHSRFKPWASARNVMLHEEHDKPHEIKAIEHALSEYCFVPTIKPLKCPQDLT